MVVGKAVCLVVGRRCVRAVRRRICYSASFPVSPVRTRITFSTSVMNFYSFDEDGKIVDDVAATGIAGILQGIGAVPDVR